LNVNFHYNSTICDLCGSPHANSLIALTNGQSMRSDRGLLAYNLSKLVCTNCGLVRSGSESMGLYDYYTEDYTLNTQTPEHYFYTPDGPLSRSMMICNWLLNAMGAQHWRRAANCLEVGAGAGALMQALQQYLPETTFEGIELNKSAVEVGQSLGLNIRQSTLEDFDGGPYDIIYSVGVIEHVPSPTSFLSEIHRRLRPGGLLYLCQPTQDVPSYDVFFVDHISHFGTEHLHQYARKAGFRDQGFCVGHEWMPNFSVHRWQAIEPDDNPFAWSGLPGYTTCEATVQSVLSDMARLDKLLSHLAAEGFKLSIFGLNEVYWLARTYSTLGNFQVSYGLDDSPNKPEYSQLGFQVIKPEDAVSLGVQNVILTMNKIYYEQAHRRLEALGLNVYPLLS